jgi:tetratricopeptide (TPR) repeat protein
MLRLLRSPVPACCGSNCARTAVLLALLVVGSGCSQMRAQLARRSSECTQLCEEARQAREQGQQQQAEQLLDAAVRRRPRDAETQLHLAEELWTGGRPLAAADMLQTLVAQRPDDAPLALRLAQMEFEIGRIDAAVTALQTSLQNDPEHPDAIRLKARMDERRGDTVAALAAYHRLLQVAPDDVDARMRLAVLHLERDAADRAAPLLREAMEHPAATRAQRAEAEWQLGLAYARLERWTDASAALQAALQTRPATAEDWYQVAYVQSRIGQQEAAFASLSQALTIEPGHLSARDLARQIKLGSGLPPSSVVPAGFQPRPGVQTALRP